MRIVSRFTAQGALAATLCWVAILAATGSTDAMLFMAPALLIAIPLLAGFYVGEELIAALAVRRFRGPRRSRSMPQASPRARPGWLPRGTRLIAFSLAKRPPPPRVLTQS